jgi:NDP-sugar pyrophosphorylase family protein
VEEVLKTNARIVHEPRQGYGYAIQRGLHDHYTLEGEPLERLAKDGQLAMYPHQGFWQCMDTYCDNVHLETLWDEGNARRTIRK